MGKYKKQDKKSRSSLVVETARTSNHPFGIIDRYRPLGKPEFAVFDAIREAVPIVDAAIQKIIRLIGSFNVECENKVIKKELNEFLQSIPTGIGTYGINAFLNSYLDSLLMYGTAIGEMVLGDKSGRLAALYNAPIKNIEIIRDDNPFDYKIAIKGGGFNKTPIKHPERILITAANTTAEHPEGRSLLEGLPFVTSVLLKIFDSVGTNFERIGNLRYAVTYKPTDSVETAFGADRAAEIAKEWSAAMSDKDGVRDFVAVGDVDIKVIGADNQMLDTSVPVKTMLEQIVAKLGIPPFMLGLSWSSTERMSQQQADILTSELEYYRSLLYPIIYKICNKWLVDEGYYEKIEIVWNHISLQDEVELARARLYRAQAGKLETSEVEL